MEYYIVLKMEEEFCVLICKNLLLYTLQNSVYYLFHKKGEKEKKHVFVFTYKINKLV